MWQVRALSFVEIGTESMMFLQLEIGGIAWAFMDRKQPRHGLIR